MKAQAVIFDLPAFSTGRDCTERRSMDAYSLLDRAARAGRHCALVTALDHRQAGQQMQRLFGDAAHHVFSVIVTNADFDACGHAAPFDVVLRLLDMDAGDAMVVSCTPRVLEAARGARLAVAGDESTDRRATRPTVRLLPRRAGNLAVRA